jgi:sugar lactone lactonase YvrE
MRQRISRGSRWTFGALLGVAGIAGAAAAPGDIPIGQNVFPESFSSSRAGDLFIGSFRGGVLRVSPHGKVSQWIAPGAYQTRSILGVLVDEPRRTLWACSSDMSAFGIAAPGNQTGSWLKAFDLATGKGRAGYPMPLDNAHCNDLAIARDGTVYVTATGPDVLRLKPGARALERWVSDPRIQPAGAGGADGIAFGADGSLYVTSIGGGQLFRVAIASDGSGQVTQLSSSRPLERPDGMRPIAGNSFALAEGGGRVDRVDIDGDRATITPLREGLNGPTAVTVAGKRLWFVEGHLSWLFDKANRNKSYDAQFRVGAIPLD